MSTVVPPQKPSYVGLKSEVKDLVLRIGDLQAKGLGKRSPALLEIEKRLSSPLFTIAITGPSRVGKSTLINALLGRQVCPMGEFPKTGIPSVFEPGEEDGFVVTLASGEVIKGVPTAEELEPWVDRQENPENEKKVEHVRVTLTGGALDQGFAIVDLPGLDDPSDQTRTSAELALETCDAVLYVLNGAAVATGSFMFTANDRDNLKKLLPRMHKTFFVINKSDAFDGGKQKDVMKYLKAELRHFKLGELLPENVFFISAQDGYLKRCKGDVRVSDETVVKLEDALAKFLVANSLTGRNRLKGILAQAAQLVAEQLTIHSVVLGKVEKSETLRRLLSDFDRVEGEIQGAISEGYFAAVEQLKHAIEDYRSRAANRFSQTVTEVPITTPPPSRDEVKAWLNAEVSRMASVGQGSIQRSFEGCANRANAAVGRVMSDLRAEVMRVVTGGVVFPNIQTSVGAQVNLNPWTPFWGTTLGLGLAGLAFGPLGALVGAAVGFLIGFFAGEGRRRQREREALIERVQTILSDSADKIAAQLEGSARAAFEDLRHGLVSRIGEARSALKTQLESIRDLPSLEQQSMLREAIQDLNALTPRIQAALEVA